MSESKILFILKRRADFDKQKHTTNGLSTGLFNSASFVDDALKARNLNSNMAIVVDNNCIDREVAKFKPTHVIIEALWVVPPKFTVLAKLHPKVKWIIRLHSNMPFLSQEGVALDWIGDYVKNPNVLIAANAPEMLEEIRTLVSVMHGFPKDVLESKIIYLPNCYPQNFSQRASSLEKTSIDIACFGAIRPLKNHVTQAIGALKFAEKVRKKLHFHINTRVERADPVFKNLQSLFNHVIESGHKLICHPWMPREEFLEVCTNEIDIGLQVSFSETFNIVGADLVSLGIPLVASNELPWSEHEFNAWPTNSDSICDALVRTFENPQLNVLKQQANLAKYASESERLWVEYFS